MRVFDLTKAVLEEPTVSIVEIDGQMDMGGWTLFHRKIPAKHKKGISESLMPQDAGLSREDAVKKIKEKMDFIVDWVMTPERRQKIEKLMSEVESGVHGDV